ncbi:DUF2280 domain-containing protein [Sphingomonas kyeonggiensis]|uniref:DUF2280 domain-containing protein n=1 Tax=Sphingomonas kyeonggiensis TaxID=1268553 RepID=UPI0016221276
MSRSQLGKDVQGHIVRGLACFDTPTEVANSVEKEFGIKLTRQAVEAYDPTKRAGARMAKKWRAVFEEARAKFLSDVRSVPIASRTYRLRSLQRMLERCEASGNFKMAAELLEQAAKEVGGWYLHRCEPSGLGGGSFNPLPQPSYVLVPARPGVLALPHNRPDGQPALIDVSLPTPPVSKC